MTGKMEQENIENTSPSVEESKVIHETSLPVGEKEILKETLPSGGTHAISDKILPSVEEQEVPKETSPSVDEQVVTKENPRSNEEQKVPKETSSSDEEQEILKETISVEEQEVPKETSPSVDEQVVTKEIPTSEEQRVSKELVPSDVEQEVLLNESEIKQELDDTQESKVKDLDDNFSIVLISDDDEELDTTPVPSSVPIILSTYGPFESYAISHLCAPRHPDSGNEVYNCPPEHYLVKKPKLRSLSVPRYVKFCNNRGKPDNAITNSKGDNNDFPFEVELKPSLKRKRSPIIPDNLEFENTRKTMKPGPKSKTRNIATIHEMIIAAKRLGYTTSMERDSEEMLVDLDDFSDEDEGVVIPPRLVDVINLTSDDEELGTAEHVIDNNETSEKVASSDDEADDIKPGTVECVIDNNETSEKKKKSEENSINDENKIIDNTVSETLNDKTNETENLTEVLKNAIDSNKIKEDENTKDKNDNDEVEEKISLNDTNEPIGVGEKQ
ncbi:unnamed protein product [Aphis gossypii]|uniref:Uncharacterized protein n=1 Tax=Aphis gossypii TaxID=80765 RepID=A0A9P0J8H4_APHGO|nr:unnamed protein product [Aphis gossypii]